MSVPSNPLLMRVTVNGHQHFKAMNDFIAFNRSKVRTYEWYHGALNDPVDDYLDIEFHTVTDALMFKLQYG
jgi:hypothetical protein